MSALLSSLGLFCNSLVSLSESSLIVSKRFISSSSCLFKKKKFLMPPSDNLYIRHVDGSETFQAIFRCNYEPMKIEREFNFNRKIAEPVDDFIKRIRANLDKILTKKTNKKKSGVSQVETPPIEISVYVGDKSFPTSKTCKELFSQNNGSNIQFSILDKKYNVVINSPWVDVLSLPSCFMTNFPVYPNKYEAVFVSENDTQFKWFSSNDGKGTWKEVGSGFMYTPSEKDLTKYLKVVCVPSNGIMTGPEKECISSCQVDSGPGACPFEERLSYTPSRLDESSMRVISYNILADVYAETDVAKTELFPYCPSHATKLDYRKQLYFKEILGFNADIICLQEVDEKVFHYDMQHILCGHEMKGVFCDKGGTIREGVATFFNTQKFRLLDSHRIILGEDVQSNPIFKPLWDLLRPNTAAANSLIERSTALQVSVLERIADVKDKLIVANTHLYFHPDADHIRLVQTGLCMEFIKHLVSEMAKKNPGDRHSLVFCGDFNSVPDCGPYLLMTSKHVPNKFKDWFANQEEVIEGVELSQPFSIKSAYGTPQFTNFTQGFADCLDYIYYQTDYLQLNQIVPLPSEEILRRHTALPSIVFPSDHVSLVADFSWSLNEPNKL